MFLFASLPSVPLAKIGKSCANPCQAVGGVDALLGDPKVLADALAGRSQMTYEN